MADQTIRIDDLRRESGATLLKMTDEVGFGAVGAAWIYSRESDRWWFLLVTPMMDTKGPLWIYERLLRVFSKWKLPEGITPLDIGIASPREEGFRRFPIKSLSAVDQMGLSMELRDFVVNGTKIDYAVLYRMTEFGKRTPDPSRLFDLRVRQLLAA